MTKKSVLTLACLVACASLMSACAPKYTDTKYGTPEQLHAAAYDKKDRKAMLELAGRYETGTGGEALDVERAREIYTELANQGDLQAQLGLGYICLWKLGDYKCALAWFGKAADQGSVIGENDLAYMYEHGLGVPPDPQQADALRKKEGVASMTPDELEQMRFTGAMKLAIFKSLARVVHAARAGGVAIVQFEYTGGGKATDVSIYKSSGSDYEDTSAVQAVEAAALPERPASMSDIHHYLIAVNYSNPF